MGGRSRIRWNKVAKLAVAGFGCLALFMGLPSLIRRPEPPPLDPDIGFAHVAEPRQPAPSRSRSKPGPRRRVAKDTARDRRRGDDRRPRDSRRRASREQEPRSAPSPPTGDPAPAPVQAPTPAAAPPPPAPPPPTPPAAPAQPSEPAAESEFGFER